MQVCCGYVCHWERLQKGNFGNGAKEVSGAGQESYWLLGLIQKVPCFIVRVRRVLGSTTWLDA